MNSSPADLAARGRAWGRAGIHCLTLPIPYPLASVNVYLVEDDPLTLVDCGPNWATALDALVHELGGLGYMLGDIELLVLTHQHMDHLGLAATLAALDARVACIDLAAQYIEHWHEAKAADDELWVDELLRHGVPAETVAALREQYPLLRSGGSAVPVDVSVPDGGVVELRNRSLRAVHRPGHSPSDTLFVDDASGIAFGGDHLLAAAPADPLLACELPGTHAAGRFRGMSAYRRSLLETRCLDGMLLLTGHGEPVADVAALVDRRIARQDVNADRLRGLLADGEPHSAYELSGELYGERAIADPLLAVSLTVGLADLLEDEGNAIRDGNAYRAGS